MIFRTIEGRSKVALSLAPYKIKWRGKSLSKFQTRIKNFLEKHFKHLDWFEEVPLVGREVSRMRWDFVCTYKDKWGRAQVVFIECQGNHHDTFNPKFHKTAEDFERQIIRDELKVMYAKENSNFPVIEFYEHDVPTLKWFRGIYPDALPTKKELGFK